MTLKEYLIRLYKVNELLMASEGKLTVSIDTDGEWNAEMKEYEFISIVNHCPLENVLAEPDLIPYYNYFIKELYCWNEGDLVNIYIRKDNVQ